MELGMEASLLNRDDG